MNEHDPFSSIEKVLLETHRSRPVPQLDKAWRVQVMDQIRLEAAELKISREIPVPAFVWRFATATCTFALALSLYVALTGLGLDQLLLQLFFNDPLTGSLLSF